jgi:hypothetical protein
MEFLPKEPTRTSVFCRFGETSPLLPDHPIYPLSPGSAGEVSTPLFLKMIGIKIKQLFTKNVCIYFDYVYVQYSKQFTQRFITSSDKITIGLSNLDF